MPVRTLRGWGRQLSLGLTLLTLFAILLLLPSWKRQTMLAPGPLSHVHAQLLHSDHGPAGTAILDSNRCAACHPNSLGQEERELLVAVHSKNGIPPAVGLQSQLCLKCHTDTMPNAAAGTPHDLVGAQLDELFHSVSSPAPKALARRVTECSQCHREHQGTGQNLSQITAHRCQSCHRQEFDSFTHGHPEFTSYPQSQPRSIAFDHASHRDLHFTKKNESFDCKSCHVSDDRTGVVGNVFRTVSFEKACASCHTDALATSSTDGVVVLQLPSIDVRAMESVGLDIGAWPTSASQIMDGELTPLWRELISNRPGGRELIQALPASGQFRDVRVNDLPQLQSVAKLAHEMRSILQSIADGGQPALRSNIQAGQSFPTSLRDVDLHQRSGTNHSLNAANSVGAQWLDAFTSGVPVDLVRTANSRWFANPTNPSLSTTEARGEQSAVTAADRTIRQPRARPIAGSVLAPPNANRIRQPKATLSNLQSGGSREVGDDDLLGGDDLLSASKDMLSMPGSDDLLFGDDDLLSSPSVLGEGGRETPRVEVSEKPLRGWEHMPYGGWMIDEARVAIVYIPKTHADPWLSRWVEWSLLQTREAAKQNPSLKVGLAGIAQQCLQCHSMSGNTIEQFLSDGMMLTDRNASPSVGTNSSAMDLNAPWRIDQRPNSFKGITKFSHTPHLTIASISDCQSCHVLAAGQGDGMMVASHGWELDGRTVHHEFKPMSKVLCSSCHRADAAGDSCTQCHNYHVHSFVPTRRDQVAPAEAYTAKDLLQWIDKR